MVKDLLLLSGWDVGKLSLSKKVFFGKIELFLKKKLEKNFKTLDLVNIFL